MKRNRKKQALQFCYLITLTFLLISCQSPINKNTQTQNDTRFRVIVSSDIGGTDPDDFQSMVHLFLYADVIDLEGIISSAYGPGRKQHILAVIDEYEKDYPNLKTYSDQYPTADSLRQITKQGAEEIAGYSGVGKPTEGSKWLIDCARRNDDRPLYVLIWGGIEDLSQALHDAPDILPRLRVYWIGGPNKKWSPDAYQYMVDNHPNLWIIESNSTYRGWFTGGNQSEALNNNGFPAQSIAGRGAIANFFMTQLGGTIKMGDTPSLAWLLNGNQEDPTQPGWGGQYIRAWERPHYQLTQMPEEKDRMQEFGIMELSLPIKQQTQEQPQAFLKVDNQALTGYFLGDDSVRFRFSPKSAKVFQFSIDSNIEELNGMTGSITAFIPSAKLANQPAADLPNWWTDNPNPEFAEGDHIGAKTVSRWREEFLADFAKRMNRCKTPKPSE
ncbi:DUF1593 domain-containing protein [Mangrovibacterium lignilyticum]|uniref:DUF1593 domain-containing protein n=1 Tax=Mangrovibacterium lignilyticum TaxID=2668052 RepID=UPI0013D07096|nr:DUF1593 domain-containing protein [Mangrovibacterium lignilyticum]